MIDVPRPTCPPCQPPKDLRRTCRHGGDEDPARPTSVAKALLRVGLTVVVGTSAGLLCVVAAATGLKDLVFPRLALIVQLWSERPGTASVPAAP